MLTKLFRRSPKYGLLTALPEARQPLRQLKKGNAEPVRQLMAPTQDREWVARCLYSLCFSGVDVELFEEWCRCEPLSPDPWLLRGKARINWAWDARSSGRAEEVTEEGWRLFYQRLGQARTDLLWAAERLPADPVPYVHLIQVHMGSGPGSETIHQLFREATARLATFYEAYSAAQYALTQQWLGSHEEMFAFTREGLEKASYDNDLAALIARAHTLRRFYIRNFDQDAEGATAYLQNREVQREVTTYFDRIFASNRYRESLASFEAWNDFASWFFRVGDKRRLRLCLEKIRGRYSGGDWEFYREPAQILREVEEMARD